MESVIKQPLTRIVDKDNQTVFEKIQTSYHTDVLSNAYGLIETGVPLTKILQVIPYNYADTIGGTVSNNINLKLRANTNATQALIVAEDFSGNILSNKYITYRLIKFAD